MGSLAMSTFKILLLLCFIELEAWEFQSYYLVSDMPVVTCLDPSVFAFLNFTSNCYGRHSNVCYYNSHMEFSKVIDNNYTMQMVLYEAVNNEYKRSLIKMQYKFCNFVFKDHFLGSTVRKQLKLEGCPIPKGAYHFYNMSASADVLPMHFMKGRINIELFYKKKNVFTVYSNFELKRKKKI